MFSRFIAVLSVFCFLSMAMPSFSVAADATVTCWAKPPVTYKRIKPIAYPCGDASEKIRAETGVSRQVDLQRANERKLAAQRALEKDKKRKLAEKQKREVATAKVKKEELLQEQAAIAASEARQVEIGDDILQKMLLMCDKYWSKGEHRCYCQKYIEHAPEDVQKNSTCE